MTQADTMRKTGQNALISLGSNVTSQFGTPQETLLKAIAALAVPGVRLGAQSRFFRTAFVPIGAGADVINAAVGVETDLPPQALLAHLHEIEARFARSRDRRWADRTLDLDLIAVGDYVLPDAETVSHWMTLAPDAQRSQAPDRLILPHPRMHERAFVLVPAAEIWPDWMHPLLGRSIREMRAALSQNALAGVTPLRGPAPEEAVRERWR